MRTYGYGKTVVAAIVVVVAMVAVKAVGMTLELPAWLVGALSAGIALWFMFRLMGRARTVVPPPPQKDKMAIYQALLDAVRAVTTDRSFAGDPNGQKDPLPGVVLGGMNHLAMASEALEFLPEALGVLEDPRQLAELLSQIHPGTGTSFGNFLLEHVPIGEGEHFELIRTRETAHEALETFLGLVQDQKRIKMLQALLAAFEAALEES